MSELIYTPVSARSWVVDFPCELGKVAGSGVTERGRVEEAAWTLCELLNISKKKYDMLSYLSICHKLCHLFTIYFIYFGEAWPGLINIFCSVCCLLERDLIGTRRRLFEVSVALALKPAGWKQSIQIWLEDNLEMNLGCLWGGRQATNMLLAVD